jgi:hypothetical protein
VLRDATRDFKKNIRNQVDYNGMAGAQVAQASQWAFGQAIGLTWSSRGR